MESMRKTYSGERQEKSMGHGGDIYGKLYDIASSNVENAGQEMVFTRKAFLFSAKRDLRNVDIFDLLEDDRDTFLQAIYIGFLLRTPEEEARSYWKNIQLESDTEYKKKVLKSIMSSSEASKYGVVAVNNMLGGSVKDSESIKPIPDAEKYWYIDKLYGYYARLPLPLRRILKKVLRGKRR